MNLILLFDEDFPDGVPQAGDVGRALLLGRRREHVVAIHRAAIGDRLRAGLLDGAIGEAVVREAGDDRVVLDVSFNRARPERLPVRLLLALPRPPTLRKVLQAVAAIGVEEIVLLQTSRVEKSYWQSPTATAAGVREQLVLGLEQGRDTVLPRVLERRRFRPFVEDELPAMIVGERALVAHPEAREPCPRAVAGRLTLAVGPEGGFLDGEVEALEKAGFQSVTLGERPLRVEHAVPYLLGRLC